MPWLSQRTHPLPTTDIVSFAFGNTSPSFNDNAPIYHDASDNNRTLSRAQSRTLVRQLVAGFRAAGLKPGDCFAISSFNDILYPIVFLGGIGAGGVYSGTNPSYRVAELRHHIRTAEVKFFIVEPELLDVVLESADAEGIPRDRIFIFNTRGQNPPPGFRPWRWLLQHGESDWIKITDPETAKNTDVARLTTSGTTGMPKMACQSHFNATSFHVITNEVCEAKIPWERRNIASLPMFHVMAVPGVHASPLRTGTPIWVMRRFELKPYLAAIQRHRITNLLMVPPIVIAVVNSPVTKKYSLKSVRSVYVSAAPLDAGTQRRLKELCADDALCTQSDDTGSVGRFMPTLDIKLVDDDGKDITDFDVRGELCIRGPTVVRGYHQNPKANAETWDGDGYLHTGDIMYCDSRTKKWYIVDRKKELIKIRGFQVAPPELEAVLLEASDRIIDVAVIGVKPKPGSDIESPRAYVVRKPGTHITEEEVKKLVGDKLAAYKQLTGGVVFVKEIPKSPSGKILKRVLREQADTEEGSSGKAKL
ncbi:acetyl-CoA synthetase-like protein [Plenodomus tracheiphilus IPT5]|uniref:Acetyl-CoA synthetase-like protein n=1 Tax=Plenodomus tracheiphilus IPT5 TaxID=1408161 RepID=A0A6A7AUI1_9PLEO|nr:acetyl-CoA synthetase-like protein [Plenodomus tracheiphilus IPT5]